MKNIALAFIISSLIITAACQPDEKEENNTLITIKEEVENNSKAYSILENLTDTIGHRLTGSKNGALAEEAVYEYCKKIGIEDVQYMPFTVESWSRDTVSLTLNGDIVDDVVSLGHSPTSASVSGELIDLGNGLRSDFEENKAAVEGKIALVYIGILPDSQAGSKNIHRSEKTALAIEYGAKGIIIINKVPGEVLLTGTASVTGKLIDIPAVCISYEKGMELRKLLANDQSITAEIFMKNNSEMITARNVIATIPGASKKQEKILIGGHLDSWDLSTGAIDNGIGIAAIMDIARTYQKLNLQPARSLQFVFFMGEEQGLLGSKAMVEKFKKSNDLEAIRYMLNIDMSGNPKGYNASGRASSLALFNKVGEKIKAADNAYENINKNQAGLHSDHQSFMMQGVPVINLNGNLESIVYDYYHSNKDDFTLVNKEHLINTVKYTSMFLWEIANKEELPAQKLNFEQTKQFMIDQDLEEELKLGNNWIWN